MNIQAIKENYLNKIKDDYIIEVRDNGGPDNNGSIDRYTVVYKNGTDMLAMSSQPFHPQGIGQHVSGTPGDHLGELIDFEDLPTECQHAVIQDYYRDHLEDKS